MTRVAVVALAVLALAGCGSGGGRGTATLWVTRDRGAHVVFTGKVPSGLTAMQALLRVQHVTTRYGGRYVQSIDGVAGSLSTQHDWFYFVNGVEANRGATEVRLHPGDIEWWDYRSWAHGQMSVPVVAGAWPEPFLHGFEGVKPGATVLYYRAQDAQLAKRLARVVHGTTKGVALTVLEHFFRADLTHTKAVRGNLIELSAGPGPRLRIRRVGNVVELRISVATARRLLSDPASVRFEYGSWNAS